MTSALEARPKLGDDVRIVRREARGKVHYVVTEPRERKYYQFGETEVALMRLMDGRRTPADIAQAAEKTLGVLPPAGQIADFAHKLKRMGIVERTPAEQRLILIEHLRRDRKIRSRGRTRGSILRLRFSIGDPDRLFDGIVRRIRWVWSRPFVWVSLGLFVAYAAVLVARWDQIWGGTVGLYTLSGFGLWDWVILYGLILGSGVLHEFGHGLTTKAFGGEVHEIGAMLLYFSPALYCNTNDAWTFQERSRRLWVNFAGPWIDMWLTGLAALVWVTTQPDTFINHLALLAVLSGGVLVVLTNINPLLPLDGYYALSDWLELPNLRRRAFEYWGWIGKHYVLGMEVAPPAVTPRERRIFLIYGSLAMVYSLFVAVVGFIWLVLVLGRFLGPWVWAILALSLIKPVKRLASRWRAIGQAASTTWRAGFSQPNRRLALFVGIALVIVLPFVIPWTFRAKGEFLVEAAPHAYVRAQVEGLIGDWHVREGDIVRFGDPIATLWNPELESAYYELQAHLDRMNVNRARAEALGDRAAAASLGAALSEVEKELALLRGRRTQLVVRAPLDGIVLGRRLHEQLGRVVHEGDLLVEVASEKGRLARVRLPLKNAGEVAAGQPAALKLFAQPNLKFRSMVATVAPAAEGGWLEVEIILPSGSWQPVPGMRGLAKIETRRGTVAKALARAVQRTIRLDLWL